MVLNHVPSWPQVHRGDYFTDPLFRQGFETLRGHGLRFDLQVNPHQLRDAATFLEDFKDVPVCLDHVGCLKLEGDAAEISRRWDEWQEGMQALAALPNIFCKLSMLAYTIPEWWTTDEGKALARDVVLKTIDIFGSDRCMFASNFPAEPQGCRADLFQNFQVMVQDFSAEIQDGLFFKNAERFYGIGPDAA